MTDMLTVFADGQLRRLLLGRARVSAVAMAGAEAVWAVIPVAVIAGGGVLAGAMPRSRKTVGIADGGEEAK
jgi:hypothetical protein